MQIAQLFSQQVFSDLGFSIPGSTSSLSDDAYEMHNDGDDEHLIMGPGMSTTDTDPVRFNGTEEEAREQLDDFLDTLKPGDLILFDLGGSHDFSGNNENGEFVDTYGNVDHVVIYAGQDENGNHMIVQEHEPGRDAEYHDINVLVFDRAGNNPAGNTEFEGNYDWEERLPVYAIRYLSDEQLERLTVE